MDHSPTPLTRRELHRGAPVVAGTDRPLTRRELHRGAPVVARTDRALTRRELRPRRRPSATTRILDAVSAAQSARGPGRHSAATRSRHGRSRPTLLGVVPAAGLVAAVAVMVAAVGLVHADHDAQLRDAALAAAVQDDERRTRADAASADRLTAAAAAYATERRAAALTLAMETLEKAESVVTVAVDVVDTETIAPLDEAIADLTALVTSSPAPMPEIDTTEVEPIDNLEDPDRPGSANGSAGAPPEQVRTEDGDPSGTPLASSRDRLAAPVPEALRPDGAHADGTSGPQAAANGLGDLDLDVTDQMLAVAERLAALADEVEAVAVAEIAAAEEAAAERAARREAQARAAAEELARRVAAADAAPNGAIPRDVLCGVEFTTGVLLRCDAAQALEELNAAYRAHFGRDLTIVSSYRDLPTQHVTKETRGDLAATPGTSQHGRGVAVDFAGFGGLGEFTSPSYLWMRDNSEAFGWIHPPFMRPGGRGPLEPWHWEYHP